MRPSYDSVATELATSTLSRFLCPWGGPAVTPCSPQAQGGCAWLGWSLGQQEGGGGGPLAPLRNPQPAPETSSRSQREPADLAAASKGGGMEGGREAARDQNEITARERGWLLVQSRQEGRWGQLSRTCRGLHPWVSLRDCCSPHPSSPVSPQLRAFPVPSAAPANGPRVIKAKESPFVPLEPPWECWSHFPPTGLPGLHRRFSSSKRSRAGGSCWLGGLYPAAHGMVHSQTFTLLSFQSSSSPSPLITDVCLHFGPGGTSEPLSPDTTVDKTKTLKAPES